MQVKVKKLSAHAILPTYATDGSGAMDLYAVRKWNDKPDVVTYETGLSFEVPPGYSMLVLSRSGHGFKSDLRLSNCVGLIDSDYRGGVMVNIRADGEATADLDLSKAIAQFIIVETPRIELIEVEKLGETDRGTAGFGSTDA